LNSKVLWLGMVRTPVSQTVFADSEVTSAAFMGSENSQSELGKLAQNDNVPRDSTYIPACAKIIAVCVSVQAIGV
jgi:hypothetical protein